MAEVVTETWAISIRRRLARISRSGNLSWLVLIGVLVVAATTIGASLLALRTTAQQERVAAKRIDQLRKQVTEAESAAGKVAPSGPEPDFVQRLPGAPDVRALLGELERSAGSAGVVLGTLQLQEHAARVEQLARVDVTISLRGNYPKLKQVLTDVLGRFRNVSLVQWRLRRVGQPVDLEATMVLALWGSAAGSVSAAPAPSAAAGVAR